MRNLKSAMEVYDSFFQGEELVKQTTKPKPNNNRPVVDMVMEDLAARKKMGVRKYGTPLQAHNGRSGLQDAYEEALDLTCYLKQVLEESKQASHSS